MIQVVETTGRGPVPDALAVPIGGQDGETVGSVREGGPVVRRDQRGMVSAEWAVGIIAAVAIAGVLLGVVTNSGVHDAILRFILMVIHSFSGYITNK